VVGAKKVKTCGPEPPTPSRNEFGHRPYRKADRVG
jgi:hypothetical protein